MTPGPAPVALVTGGGHRLGAAMVRRLAARGFRVAIHYNASATAAGELAREVGGGAATFPGDLSQVGAPAALVRAVVAAMGPIQVLVNSAATFVRTPLDQVTERQFDDIFAVNLRAPFFLALEAAKSMPEGGCIVNMSDLAGFETWPGYIPHGMAKGGVAAMTRALAHQMAPRVRVNAIAPGVVLLPDDMGPAESNRLASTTPLGRHGSPVDIVQALDYLLDATFVTGEILFVDGGRHVRR